MAATVNIPPAPRPPYRRLRAFAVVVHLAL